ncbi:MAG TPA: hemerythrin domain-containing protein [Patescibacteria group bacterium]|nr:hemerythrin domain-containing protein [Patescibacteria group bacterium]
MALTSKIEGVLPLSIYSVLKGEHDEVAGILKTLETVPTGQDLLMKKLSQELLSHAAAEQATVYPRTEQRLKDNRLIKESKNEHEDIREWLIALSGLDLGSVEWKQELKELEERIQHHVHEEETDLFAVMKQIFSDDEAKELAKQFREAKDRELNLLKY